MYFAAWQWSALCIVALFGGVSGVKTLLEILSGLSHPLHLLPNLSTAVVGVMRLSWVIV